MSTPRNHARRLFGVNLKAYFGIGETDEWLTALARRLEARPLPAEIELAVLPSFPVLERAGQRLAAAGVAIGAQDLAAGDEGSRTGEVSGGVLAELGCRYVAVGHAERRRLLGESDALVAAKVAAAVGHGLVPIVCVGEAEQADPGTAAAEVVWQTAAALAGLPAAEVVIAYEPVWAIGAEEPAPPAQVLEVGAALRAELDSTGHDARILYGGSAGPGTLAPLVGRFDGLFLGRRAHRIAGLLETLEEAASAPRPTSGPGRDR